MPADEDDREGSLAGEEEVADGRGDDQGAVRLHAQDVAHGGPQRQARRIPTKDLGRVGRDVACAHRRTRGIAGRRAIASVIGAVTVALGLGQATPQRPGERQRGRREGPERPPPSEQGSELAAREEPEARAHELAAQHDSVDARALVARDQVAGQRGDGGAGDRRHGAQQQACGEQEAEGARRAAEEHRSAPQRDRAGEQRHAPRAIGQQPRGNGRDGGDEKAGRGEQPELRVPDAEAALHRPGDGPHRRQIGALKGEDARQQGDGQPGRRRAGLPGRDRRPSTASRRAGAGACVDIDARRGAGRAGRRPGNAVARERSMPYCPCRTPGSPSRHSKPGPARRGSRSPAGTCPVAGAAAVARLKRCGPAWVAMATSVIGGVLSVRRYPGLEGRAGRPVAALTGRRGRRPARSAP
jgi:hypothetical protein